MKDDQHQAIHSLCLVEYEPLASAVQKLRTLIIIVFVYLEDVIHCIIAYERHGEVLKNNAKMNVLTYYDIAIHRGDFFLEQTLLVKFRSFYMTHILCIVGR